MHRMIAWFASNHVAANLLMALLVIGGLLAVPTILMKPFPDIDIDMVTVTVEYRGAAPQETEEGICVRIEEEIESVVVLLLDHGADPNARDTVGWPPLHWAVSRRNLEIIERLIDAGADVNARDLAGQTALKHARGSDDIESLLKARGATSAE